MPRRSNVCEYTNCGKVANTRPVVVDGELKQYCADHEGTVLEFLLFIKQFQPFALMNHQEERPALPRLNPYPDDVLDEEDPLYGGDWDNDNFDDDENFDDFFEA